MKSEMIGAKKMQFDQYTGHCIVSNFRLHRDSHVQISTATEAPPTPTLVRFNLIRLAFLDWPSWLLLLATSALLCHLLADHEVSLHIVDWYWWKLCCPVFCLWSSFASHTHTLATFWHLLLLKIGFSTKLHLHCLHLTRVCGLCHHPPLSNSGNVSGHHLAGSNKTGCWSSVVSFVVSFSSVQFCHPCHLSAYSRWLCPLIWTWNLTMLSSPSPTSCGLIDHRAFFTDSTKCPPMLCVFTAKRAPSGIRLGVTRRSLFMILLTPAFCCAVCSLIALPNSARACVRNMVWFKAASVGWINVSLSVRHTPPVTCFWICWPSSAAPSFDSSVLPHCLSLSLNCFCQNFPKMSVHMTTNPTFWTLLALFVRAPLCLRPSLLDPDSVSCAWLVTIPLEVSLHQVLWMLS